MDNNLANVTRLTLPLVCRAIASIANHTTSKYVYNVQMPVHNTYYTNTIRAVPVRYTTVSNGTEQWIAVDQINQVATAIEIISDRGDAFAHWYCVLGFSAS